MTDKEKLKEVVRLAYGMYYAAQYLTTDASGLRKAMEEYHRFIITEYHKQEPASEELKDVANKYGKDTFVNECMVNGVCDNNDLADAFKAGAQWQREQMMKDAVKGQVERGYCEDGISEHFEVFAYLSGRDERFKDLSDEQLIKLIILPSHNN